LYNRIQWQAVQIVVNNEDYAMANTADCSGNPREVRAMLRVRHV
jgi:hypothetical protein